MIRPIRTEGDYEAAVERIEELIDAKEGTPEGDELEVLAALVGQYESKAFPVAAPTPVAAIRFRMEQQGLTPRDLEPLLGSRSRVSEVLSGARSLSMDMVRALHTHLGIPASVLIQEEEHSEGQRLQPTPAVVRSLMRCSLMNPSEDFGAFLGRAFCGTPAHAMLRKTRTERTAKFDAAALQAWCAAVLLKSKAQKVAKRKKITLNVARSIAQLSAHADGIDQVQPALAELGICFVVMPHFQGTHLDGAALKRHDNVPVVGLTLRHDRIDNFWFTLMHELAHVEKHLNGHDIIIDDLDVHGASDLEEEADRLASVALIPTETWDKAGLDEFASIAAVMDVAEEAGVHPSVVAGRWQREHRDFRRFSKLLGRGQVRSRFAHELSHS
ncbi:MAG TPA: ImmA/IrrE family metallo-endopeptidase [Sphingomicrobium sp.]